MSKNGKRAFGTIKEMVVIVGLAALMSGPLVPASSMGQEARPGQCSAFTADDIDECFTTWATQVSFDPMVDWIECKDMPSGPSSLLFFEVAGLGGGEFLSQVRQGFDGPRIEIHASGDFVLLPAECFGFDLAPTVPAQHICRAEILRSFTWRQHCAHRVER